VSLESLIQLAGDAAQVHAPLGARTTYRVGGTARVLLTARTRDELAAWSPLLRDCGCRVIVVGNGSNLLVADGEIDVVAVVLAGQFEQLRWRDVGDVVVVVAGAALDLPVAARRLADDGVTGFEWAVGVPGSFGGAAVMNAGGHGSDMAHSVTDVTTWSLSEDRLEHWSPERLHYGYRHSALGERDLVVEVTLTLTRGDRELARQTIREIVRWRRAHQPGGANAGSVFVNPPGASAGALIEAAGLKGRRHGSAQVSEKHANFIQVDPGGRASDVLALMAEVRDAVEADCGVRLESELRTVGFGEPVS
jgi:UDP-N-acetylmuramate dehydrogenase